MSRWKKPNRKRNKKNRTAFVGYNVHGSYSAVPCDHRIAVRYLELHHELPDDLTSWSDHRLDELIGNLPSPGTGNDRPWEIALILLGHHQSARAAEILADVRRTLSGDLAQFAELAYAEAVGWLGFDYVREEGKEAEVTPSIGSAAG